MLNILIYSIQQAIKNVSHEKLRTQHIVKKQAESYYYKMRASVSTLLCKIASYVLFKIFRRIASRILVCPSQMQRLKQIEKVY